MTHARPPRSRVVVRSVLVHGLLLIAGAIVLLPLVWLLISSLKQPKDFFDSMFLPPGDGPAGVAWDRLTLDNYRRLFMDMGAVRPLINSTFLASVTALLATLVSAAAGYAVARLRFRGRSIVWGAVLAALIIPPPLLLAPGYVWLHELGLLDRYAGLIVPAMAPAFGVFLFRQATLQSVPSSLIEAARLDGLGEVGIFARIALPLLRPMAGAFLMITFVATWNNFITPQVVLQDPLKQPLSVAIAQLSDVYFQDYGLMLAGVVVSVLPVMALFLLLQREFLSGLTAGAVKG